MTTMVSTIGHGTWYAPGPHSHIYDDSIALWVNWPTDNHTHVRRVRCIKQYTVRYGQH